MSIPAYDDFPPRLCHASGWRHIREEVCSPFGKLRRPGNRDCPIHGCPGTLDQLTMSRQLHAATYSTGQLVDTGLLENVWQFADCETARAGTESTRATGEANPR